METKHCSRCGNDKPTAEFYKNRGHKDGLSAWCKVCHKADEHRRWREKHPEPPPYTVPTEKVCSNCFTLKPMDQFHLSSKRRDGRQVWCKLCANAMTVKHHQADRAGHARRVREYYHRYPDRKADAHLRFRLGIPPGTYAKMFAAQHGVCAICGTATPGGNSKRLHVDHNAATGTIRGLLCNHCNNGIGRFHDNPTLLRAAASYLDKYSL